MTTFPVPPPAPGRLRPAPLAVAFLPTVALLALALDQVAVGRNYRAGSAVCFAACAAIGGVLVAWPRVRWLLPAVAPLLLAGVDGIFHEPFPAAAPAALGLVALVLLARGIDVQRGIDRGVAVIRTGLVAVAGGIAFVGLVLPGWAWNTVRRRDAFHRSRGEASAWFERPGAVASATALGSTDPDGGSRLGLAGRLAWGVGCVVLLVAANYGLGWGIDEVFPHHHPAPALTAAGPVPKYTGPIVRDPRNDSPAMAAYPWRAQYFVDIQKTLGGYWPYTEYRPQPYSSPYLNIRGWLRKSYEPTGDRATMPTVWMFGGSTTWGEGQRDKYTIASWVSRLAARDHLPIRISNFGERGWTAFQEMLLYEQQLGLQAAPDFSLFYDGANEVTTQSLVDEPVPSHVEALAYAQKLYGTTVATRIVEPDGTTGDHPVGQLWRDYAKHSLVHKLVRLVRPDAADAAPARTTKATPPPAGAGFTTGQDQNPDGAVYNYKTTEQDGIDAGHVYEQGKQITLLLSREHHVQPYLFWQPVNYGGPAQDRAREELTSPTIDLSNALDDHRDVYIDGVHTNEEGARLMAVQIWKRMEPGVRTWYEDHR